MIEELEVELIKLQRIEETISKKITEILRRNLIRSKNKYIIYTDGALNTRAKEKAPGRDNMGIEWVQTNDTQEWPEEEIALELEGWPTSTIAELVAIWAAILTVPKETQVEIYTDSNAVIRNISRGLEQ